MLAECAAHQRQRGSLPANVAWRYFSGLTGTCVRRHPAAADWLLLAERAEAPVERLGALLAGGE